MAFERVIFPRRRRRRRRRMILACLLPRPVLNRVNYESRRPRATQPFDLPPFVSSSSASVTATVFPASVSVFFRESARTAAHHGEVSVFGKIPTITRRHEAMAGKFEKKRDDGVNETRPAVLTFFLRKRTTATKKRRKSPQTQQQPIKKRSRRPRRC